MSKILIGSTLGQAIVMILDGTISADDVGKIYTDTYFTEDDIHGYIYGEDDSLFKKIAANTALAEICKKYGVEALGNIEDETNKQNACKQFDETREALLPKVLDEAENLLYYLYNSNKIIQLSYRIPREQDSIIVQSTPAQRKQGYGEEFATSGNWNRRCVCIDGQFYLDLEGDARLETGFGRIFDNELEVLACKLRQTPYYNKKERKVSETREFFMKKIFPQYEAEISKVCEIINTSNFRLSETEILEIFNKLLEQKGEHTAKEIGEGVKNMVTQEAIQDALAKMTMSYESQQEDNAIEKE